MDVGIGTDSSDIVLRPINKQLPWPINYYLIVPLLGDLKSVIAYH